MPRSLKKGPFVDQRLMEKIGKAGLASKQIIKTWKRACTIVPEMIGFTFGVHNGKDFINVSVSEEMVGHKLGEFSPTTKFSKHGGRMQKDLESKAAQTESAKVEATKDAPAPSAAKPAAKPAK